MRPSSFIAPVEKNVELSNGAAMVITIKTRRTREIERQEKKKTGGDGEGKVQYDYFLSPIMKP